MKYWMLYAFIIVFSLSGCKRHKMQKSATGITVDTLQKGEISVRSPESKEGENVNFTIKDVDFSYLTTRSKVGFKAGNSGIDNADLTLRMKKDSIIWFTAGQFGITGARGLITRDTVTIVNVLDRSYTQLSFQQLSARFGIELNFDLLQAIIIGTMPWKYEPASVSKTSEAYWVHQQEGSLVIDNQINVENNKLTNVKATQGNRTLDLAFSDFNSLNSFLFPFTSQLQLQAQTADGKTAQTSIELRHKKVDLTQEKQSFPFSIPSRYTRK
ncbi:DUF4292 domain-containing protein [Siphonobacter sp. SORGH_AS_0500]|uniref:DUF4292 domain-containing protein n=2 Tax=Siphonobacter sp. SORGH_AS_0500 TaxID=1864824 RepID=UPI0012FEB0CA|nr:DUF4292 domain-containing protein [Siphonobacter sp. SORGH_AS_0500]MDR6196981.1 hypothetical protein [Siphonobacter sp. SORGH_AS_0500]